MARNVLKANAPAVWKILITLGIALGGMLVANLMSFPIPVLTGPALAVSIAGLAGVNVTLPNPLRDVAFVILGISIGAGMSAETTRILLQLPLVFAALAGATVLAMLVMWKVLIRYFGFDPQSAILAASPGHLSFVLSMGAQYDLDVARITIVQSIRLLALTMLTPLVALAMGIDIPAFAPQGAAMPLWIIAILAVLAYLSSLVLHRLRVPAPLLIGAMLVSMLGHGLEITPGQMHANLTIPAFVILGTLIGTRFGTVSFADLRRSALAGSVATIVTVGIALVFAVSAALMTALPIPQLLIAFAPGGLETMVAMSVAFGIAPGFVAACHLGRLLILSVAVPLAFARITKRPK